MPLPGGCYKGKPFLTRREAGKGAACYCTRTLTDDLARDVVVAVLNKEGMAMREEPLESLVGMTRGLYVIIVNYGNEPEERLVVRPCLVAHPIKSVPD